MEPVSMSGNLIREDWETTFDKYNRTADFVSEFIGVNLMSPSLPQLADGFLGIQPYTANEAIKTENFMYQLQSSGLVDHQIVSFYMSQEKSVIKFGSWDPQGVAP